LKTEAPKLFYSNKNMQKVSIDGGKRKKKKLIGTWITESIKNTLSPVNHKKIIM